MRFRLALASLVAVIAMLFPMVFATAAHAASGVSLDNCLGAGGHVSGKYCSNPGGLFDGFLIID